MYWVSKWGEGEQGPKDREDKGKKGESTGTRRIDLSDKIYEIYAYFIDRATNARNNSECNNIIFLIWVPFT